MLTRDRLRQTDDYDLILINSFVIFFFFYKEYNTCSRFQIVKQFLAHLVVVRIHSFTHIHEQSSLKNRTRHRDERTENHVAMWFFSLPLLSLPLSLSLLYPFSYSLFFFSSFSAKPQNVQPSVLLLRLLLLLLVMVMKKNDQQKARRQLFLFCYIKTSTLHRRFFY